MKTTKLQDIVTQTLRPAIEDFTLVVAHRQRLQSNITWTDVGILIDEDQSATLVLLLQNSTVMAVLRFCLTVKDSVFAITELRKSNGKIFFGSYQGNILTLNQIRSLSEINQIWLEVDDQIAEVTEQEVSDFYQSVEEGSKKKGRGPNLTTATKNKVKYDSHGRCMYEGCGQILSIDELTGQKGNYSYFAHNIATAENGTRGVPLLSDALSDEPSNILLMCDKHHRLIDTVAAADYTALRLTKMRRDFCRTVNRLLIGLSYQPIQTFSVLWPVNGHVIAPPSELQIAQCLAKMELRPDSQINDISDNEATLRESKPGTIKLFMLDAITYAANTIVMQGQATRHRAALFAFGLMPPLIALGAKIGNKNEITPMLRFRDRGQWSWPADEPQGVFYTIEGLDTLSDNEPEVVLALALTAKPNSFKTAFNEINQNFEAKLITVCALDDVIGNGALAHPKDGIDFMKDMQKLLHELKDKHGIKRVHLLPCASNAACLFFGKAIDKNHPDVLVYDYSESTLRPDLLISNVNNKCELTLPE